MNSSTPLNRSKRDSKLASRLGSSLTYPQRLQLAFSILDVKEQGFLDFKELWDNGDSHAQVKAMASVGVRLKAKRFTLMHFFDEQAKGGVVDYPKFVQVVCADAKKRMHSPEAEEFLLQIFAKMAGTSGVAADRVSSEDAMAFLTSTHLSNSRLGSLEERGTWLGAFSWFIERELGQSSARTAAKLTYREFATLCRRGVDTAVAEALSSIQKPHEGPRVEEQPQRPRSSSRRGSVSVSTLPASGSQRPRGRTSSSWDVSRLVKRRSTAGVGSAAAGGRPPPPSPSPSPSPRVRTTPNSNMNNNNNNNNSSSNNRMSWVSNSSLEDASDEDGNPQGSSPNGSDGRGGHGDNGDLPVPLSMINGLVPLISDSDIDEHDAKPLSHLELDKLESLQRDLAALLIRHAQEREGSEDGSSSSVDDSSTASSSATMGPLHELLASLRTVGISYSDLPEAYQSREPSHYELALIDELLAAQVLNRKLKQKLQVIHHDPNMYHTVRYPALADVPVPPEYDPRYIAQSALRRRMTGAIGSEENLFEEAHDLLGKMRKLHADRSKDENFVGALLSDKYAIVNVGNVEGGGEGADDGGGEASNANNANGRAAAEERATAADNNSSSSNNNSAASTEVALLREENKLLRTRLEEVDADRGDFDQMSLNVQMLREALRTRGAAMDDLQKDNRDLRKQLDEVIHDYRKQQIASSFPDKQTAAGFNFHVRGRSAAEGGVNGPDGAGAGAAAERGLHSSNAERGGGGPRLTEGGAADDNASLATTIASSSQQQQQGRGPKVEMVQSHYLVDMQVTIEDLEHKLRAEVEARETSERGLDEAQDRLHQALEDLARQRDVHQADEDELARLKHLVAYLEEATSSLGEKNDELSTQAQRMGNLVAQKQELERKVERLIRENGAINALRQENLTHEKKLRDQSLHVDQLKRELQRGESRDAALQQLRSQVRDLTADNQTKRIELSRRVMVERNYEQLKERTANLQQRVDDANSSMAVGELTKLRIERDRFRGEVAALESEVGAQDDELKRMGSALADAHAQVELGLMAHADLRSTQEELQHARHETEELKKALSEHAQDGGELDLLRDEVRELEDKLRRASQAAKYTNNQLTDNHLELSRARNQLEKANMESKVELAPGQGATAVAAAAAAKGKASNSWIKPQDK